MAVDSTKKIITAALGVCLVCSILVSTAAVTLRSIQEDNKQRDKLKNILIAGDLYTDNLNIKEIYEKNIRPVIVDLNTGNILSENEYIQLLNPQDFDIKKMARNPQYSQIIPAEKDLAQIKRMPKYMTIYHVIKNGKSIKIILPIYGRGLWSTMYGFIALDQDLKTIRGFTFYEHGETPGLGGEVDNASWKAQWNGKQAFDEQGNVQIKVIKGKVDLTSPNAKYQIDGLSGSTLTTRGVDQTVRFWLGENGYGPFIRKLRWNTQDV